jgi:hypothetical protein
VRLFECEESTLNNASRIGTLRQRQVQAVHLTCVSPVFSCMFF